MRPTPFFFGRKFWTGMTSVLGLSAGLQAQASSASDMDRLVGRFVGQYTTGDQSEATRGGFTHVNYIGCTVNARGFDDLPAGTRILYEERNFEIRPVHYQRVLVLIPKEGNTIEMRIHQVLDKARFLGSCRQAEASRLTVEPSLLLPSECSQFYTVSYDAAGNDLWVGETPAEGCPSKWFPGSVYMSSRVEIPAERLIRVWGKFYDAQGQQVGGVGDEPYLYLALADEAAARAPLEAALRAMTGKWKGTEQRFDANGKPLSSATTTEVLAFDGRKFEGDGAATSAGTITAFGSVGGLTPDGRLFTINREGMLSVCRLQAPLALACTSWDYVGANLRWTKSIETLTQEASGLVRAKNFQEFEGEQLSAFGFSESRNLP